ncbi:hypothetical protein Moror_7366 [Moniliophthora roreri MCA 2997]|uniref:F-box domain-containing protein n=1 Tax=Moniliophthora roreri (strain MCA 2997) TaxID=1381753 RepID=V2XT36_MONRO|nr:hypothetical protein Moror_7366 [Moniliophthora roreri MCA 2997]
MIPKKGTKETRRSLEILPNEILTQIAASVPGPRERARLSRCSKRFQMIVKAHLYNQITLTTPYQAENFSRSVLTGDRNLAGLVREFHLVLISAFQGSYECKSLVTLLNNVLLRLEKLRTLQILIESDNPDHLHLCLSHCKFPELISFSFGHSSDRNAFGILEFLKEHKHLHHVLVETRKNFHAIVPPSEGDAVKLPDLKSYSGPLNFLDHIAGNATALESIVIKMTLDGSSVPQPNIPEQQLSSLEKVRNRGKDLSLAVEANVTAHFILELLSRTLPELSSIAIFCRNGDPMALTSSGSITQGDVERTALYFAGLKALKKFTYHDPPSYKPPPASLNVGEEVKKLGIMCPSLKEVSLYGFQYTRKEIGGWTLKE